MITSPEECLRNLHFLVTELRIAVDHRNGDGITELVERYVAVTEDLFKKPLNSGSANEILEVTQLAEDILRLQAEIQVLAAPWVCDLRIVLRESKKEQALNATYRTEL